MKSTTINGTTFTEIIYRMHDEEVEQYGLLIHDENDTFHDGDMIIGNGCELPETEEDAEIILTNEAGSYAFHIEDGLYIID